MPKAEARFLDFFRRHVLLVLFVLAVGLSVWVRIAWLPIIGADMDIYFLPWSKSLAAAAPGIFRSGGVGIYSVPLQLMLWACEVLPIETATAIKLFSYAGDYLMALAVALIVLQLRPKADPKRVKLAFAAFAATTLMPLVVLNSAYWGQSDVLYACPAIFAVYYLIKNRWLPAFALYGLALGVKLQAIMLLPLFVMVYFVWRRFSALWFLLPVGVWFATTLPAVFMGAPPLVGLDLYAGLTGYDKVYFMNYPNLSALARNWLHEYFIGPATALAALALFAMLALILYRRLWLRGEGVLLLGGWCVLCCVFLLPGMHERYAYVAEVLLWAWFFVRPEVKRFALAAAFTFVGYGAYASFLFGFLPLPIDVLAILFTLAFAVLTWLLVKTLPRRSADKL